MRLSVCGASKRGRPVSLVSKRNAESSRPRRKLGDPLSSNEQTRGPSRPYSRPHPALYAAAAGLSAERFGPVPEHQMGADGVLPRRLLRPAVRALGPWTERTEPGGPSRFSESPLLFLLHRAVAAGGLLLHRPANHRRYDAVSDECGGRPHLVRISLPADRVDGSLLCGRALHRGRPPRPHEEGRRQAHRAAHRRGRRQAFGLALHRVVDRRRLGALLRRRAYPGKATRHRAGAGRRLYFDRRPDLHHLHARRPHARAGLRLHVPVAAHSGGTHRRMGAQRHLPLRPRRAAFLDQEGR